MVSIHNTHEFHNYISSLPVQEFKVNPNTILEYIKNTYPDAYSSISTKLYLRNKLNNLTFKYTVFFPTTDFDYKNLLDHIYKGEMLLENGKQYILMSESGKRINIDDMNVNGKDTTIQNIKLGNGIIHIL